MTKVTNICTRYTKGATRILNLYDKPSEILRLTDRIHDSLWIEEVTIQYSPNTLLPKLITTIDKSGNVVEQYFLNTVRDPTIAICGMTFQGVYILGGDWDNEKLNYIYSRVRCDHREIAPEDTKFNFEVVEVPPTTNELTGSISGGDLPNWTDSPIRASLLLGGLVVWLLYLAKGVI